MKRTMRIALIYGASLVASIGAFLLIRNLGHSLVAAGTAEPLRPVRTGPLAGGSTPIHVLLALAVVIVLARVLGLTFRRFNQPQVMGEVIAGILLGPSFFGWLAPWAASQYFR
jgi:Sodium/hydrogen exchanger family